jgi:acetoin utilization deacetylase AcuC-like enzyme
VISAGFDTSHADPSTFFELSDDIFCEISKRIGSLNLPVVILHEGGYAVEKNGSLAVNFLRGITKN